MSCEAQRVDHLDWNETNAHEIARMLSDGVDTLYIFYAAQSAEGPPHNVFRVYMRRFTASTATLSAAFQVSDNNSGTYNPRGPVAFRLDDGTLICAWSGTTTSSPIKAAESYDNGTTWTTPTTLSSSTNLKLMGGNTDGTNCWLVAKGTGSPVSGQLHWFTREAATAWLGHGRIFHITGDTSASVVTNSWILGFYTHENSANGGVLVNSTTGFFAGGRHIGDANSDMMKIFRTTSAAPAVVARPNGTLSTGSGTWTDQGGGSTNIHQSIDDGRYSGDDGSDADYIESGVGLSGAALFHLEDVADPGTNDGHTVYFRAYKVNSTTGTFTVTLRQGSTAIESWGHTVVGTATWGDYTRALSAANVANITDYSDLRLEITPGGGLGQQIRISLAYLETVSASATWAEVMVEDRTGDSSTDFNPRSVVASTNRIYMSYILDADIPHIAYSDDSGATWTVVGEPAVTSETTWDPDHAAFAIDAADNLLLSTVIFTLPGITNFRVYKGDATTSGWMKIEDCTLVDPFDNVASVQPGDSLILGTTLYHLGGYVDDANGDGTNEWHLMLIILPGAGDEDDDEDDDDRPGTTPGNFNVNRIWRRGIIQSERISLPQPGAMSAATIESLDQVKRVP